MNLADKRDEENVETPRSESGDRKRCEVRKKWPTPWQPSVLFNKKENSMGSLGRIYFYVSVAQGENLCLKMHHLFFLKKTTIRTMAIRARSRDRGFALCVLEY